MTNRRDRHVDAAEAGIARTPAIVDVFLVEKKRLIEPAESIEHVTPRHETRARDPIRGHRRRGLAPNQIPAREPVIWEPAREPRRAAADDGAESRKTACRRLHGSVEVEHARSRDTGVRMRREPGLEPARNVIDEFGVGIE